MTTRNSLAIRYNDISVLENHHVSTGFKVGKELKVFNKMERDDYKKFRQLVIIMVLGTDMSKHFQSLGKFKGKFERENTDLQREDKELMLEICIHIADISNPAKPWKLCEI